MSDLASERAAWAAAVAGPDAVTVHHADDLDGATAAIWLEGYDPSADDVLLAAASQGVRLVVAVPAAAGPRLAALLGGTAVPHWESVIGESAPEDALCHLVCTNVALPRTRAARAERAADLLRAANARLRS